MALLDPAERIRTGQEHQSLLTGRSAAEPSTVLESTWRDFVYAEIWTRPALDRRSRFWIAMAGAACSNAADHLDNYVRGALSTGDVTVSELREGALHLAVYAGWQSGERMDRSITRIVGELGLQNAPYRPLRAEPWDPEERLKDGAAGFHEVMVFPGPPAITAYFQGGILNFVFGEMWTRPGLDQRSRRWITLVGVAESSSEIPIQSHVWSAMASGNATAEEVQEFVLQYAIHGGWPRASVMQGAALHQAKRIADGLPYA